jgi:hypothetical protein
VVSTADPRSGTYHGRTDLSGDFDILLRVYGFPDCDFLADRGTAARVEPGDFVRFGAWLKVTDTVNDPDAWLRLWFFDETYLIDTFVQVELPPLTTSYAYHEIDTITPSGYHYLWAEIEPNAHLTGGSGRFMDVDDCELEVQP